MQQEASPVVGEVAEVAHVFDLGDHAVDGLGGSVADAGVVEDRDVNSASTPAAWGEHQHGSCPCTGDTQVRNPNPWGRSAEPTPEDGRRHARGGWVAGWQQQPYRLPRCRPVKPGTSQPRTRVAQGLDPPRTGVLYGSGAITPQSLEGGPLKVLHGQG